MGDRLRYPAAMALAVATAAGLALLPLSAMAGQAAAATAPVRAPQQPPDRTLALPRTPAPRGHLAAIGGLPDEAGVSGAQARAIAAASVRARATGGPVTVGAMTTGTTTVTATPHDQLSLTEHMVPVRVATGRGWVPVSTTLARAANGSLSPAAVPGDAVAFSDGGSGRPLATISAAHTSLSLWWPGSLPVPAVSGATATYRNLMPGVDLVLTATSIQAGGFSEVLVVRSAAAAANPALARLRLGITARSVRLTAAVGGGLVASAPGLSGYYAAPAPSMWDSSALTQSASRTAVRSALAAARTVGAGLEPPGPSASVTGPGGGSRLAPVAARVSADGKTLSLVPDRALLTSKATRWPVYIDPSFEWWPAPDGDMQAYIPLQSDCPKAQNYNSPTYPVTPVGFDDWGGECAANSTDYSDFRLAVPTVIWGAHLNSATVKAYEAYSSDCSLSADVTLSWSGNFGQNTTWNTQPRVLADQDTQDVGPDPGSCHLGYDFTSTVGVSFNVMNAMTRAAKGQWSAFAFRLWQQSSATNGNDFYLKQFGNGNSGKFAPFLQITYNDTPDVPSLEKATPNSDGTKSAGCATSTKTQPPVIGAISGSGPYLWAHYVDDDGDEVQGTIRYWKYPASAPAYNNLDTASDLAKAGATVAAAIPASFYLGLADDQVIAWDAEASDGTYTSAWSSTCYFTALPRAPGAPTLSAPVPGSNCPGGVITAGCQITFTITAAAGDPATEFVWNFDENPATTGPPADEILAASGSPPTAKLTITVPSPGPHNLWVYASDAGANDSGWTNGTPANSGDTTFTAAGDPAVTCATWADALADTCNLASAPNTMISRLGANTGVSCGAGTGDGGGGNFDVNELEHDGWQSGRPVTIDGATFMLPSFGGCQPDNVLAADQTIGTAGQGTSLVFLATSTSVTSETTGLTGANDSGKLASDASVPGVPGDVPATGGGCTPTQESDANEAGCEPASGSVNYVSGCAVPSTSYDLTVPDWVAGPGDIAALTTSNVVGGNQAAGPKLYAFAVPIDPACAITSVTLPDVSASVDVPLDSGSSPLDYQPAALHIFGMAVRNTTTATPQAGGGALAAPAGQSWTGAWAAPVEDAAGPPTGSWGNQTLRIAAEVSVGGSQVRIRLSNPGFISTDGEVPLQIGHATIATESSPGSPVPAATPVPLTFSGSLSVAIPAGGDIYSDPLSFPVTAGQTVLISLYLANAPVSLPYLPMHGWTDNTGSQWVSAPALSGISGDQAADTTGTPFTSVGSWWGVDTDILSGVDVTTPQTSADPGGIATVSVLGDNLTDVNYNGFSTHAISFPIVRLTGGLTAAEAGSFGVVTGGVNSNQVSADTGLSSGLGGVSAIARLDRDVLAEPGIGTVIIDEGLQDVLHGAGQQQLDDAYEALVTELSGFRVNVILATITPCGGYSSTAAADSCSTTVDGVRGLVNQDMNTMVAYPNCLADFDNAVTAGGSPAALQTADDVGDHVNLTQAGYTALTSTAEQCAFAASQNPPPP